MLSFIPGSRLLGSRGLLVNGGHHSQPMGGGIAGGRFVFRGGLGTEQVSHWESQSDKQLVGSTTSLTCHSGLHREG